MELRLTLLFPVTREQCDREQALEDFKTGEVRVLVATDVASRGLDVKDITYVVDTSPSNCFLFQRTLDEIRI